jgi:hypothetical protein
MKTNPDFSPTDVDNAGPDDVYDAINNQTDVSSISYYARQQYFKFIVLILRVSLAEKSGTKKKPTNIPTINAG